MIVYREHLAQVSTALADSTRREIMEFVSDSEEPLSVRQVARHFGLHENAARLHLDKLVKGGLLRVVRSKGKRGGRPAHLYRASETDWEICLPPRYYRLLAEVMVRAVEGGGKEASRRAESEAFLRGREEALSSASPLALLSPESPTDAVAVAWEEEIRRRGLRVRLRRNEDGEHEITFLNCPFGCIPGDEVGVVCEVHRRLEEGFLSTAGRYALGKGGSRCAFVLSRTSSP